MHLLSLTILGSELTLYNLAFYFIIYSVIGWIVEVCYMTVELGEFQNRGFLGGPICPIYGFGVNLIIIALSPLEFTFIPLWICSSVLCTVLELGVGIGMNKLFKSTWWDYSHERFNFRGYICLKISIIWGLACVVMLKIVQPFIGRVVNKIPREAGEIFLVVVFFFILFDLIIALCVVNKLNARLKQIDEIAKKLRLSSEKIGEGLAGEVLELKTKYDSLISQKRCAQERILKAFPTMKSQLYSFSMEQLRNKISLAKIREKKD